MTIEEYRRRHREMVQEMARDEEVSCQDALAFMGEVVSLAIQAMKGMVGNDWTARIMDIINREG